ncbi:MAG: aminopeptidase [Lachnospiraceae bacterium]|nr:aminopeptidase [Lachnospiraceae bacterium]
MNDLRLDKLAEVLVSYSTKVRQGDIVCVSGEEVSLPFIKAISKEAAKKGGIVRYIIDIPEIDEFILKNGSEAQINIPNFRFGECIKGDVWISAWGTDNVNTFKSVSPEKLKLRRLGNSENHKTYMKKSATGELRWCGTQFPTPADAQYAGMSLLEYEEFVYNAGFLYEADPVSKWREIEKRQEKWIGYLDKKEYIRYVAKDTDINICVKGRKWINCCGKENFPDGEIFTSPVEYDINGKITFSYPAIMNGHEFEEVSLVVHNGRITDVSCKNKDMQDILISYIDTDNGSRFFGEAAIGTNYNISRYTKNILFDEKMGGTVHMAIGAAMEEAGGKNESAIHWDMINDMTNGGKIYADGELFYENGRFIEDILKG